MAFFDHPFQDLAYYGSIVAAATVFMIAILFLQKNRERKSKIIRVLVYMAIALAIAAAFDYRVLNSP